MNQIPSSVYEVKQKSLAVKNQGIIKRAACLLPYAESEFKNVIWPPETPGIHVYQHE
jgi:hypothetical protein